MSDVAVTERRGDAMNLDELERLAKMPTKNRNCCNCVTASTRSSSWRKPNTYCKG